MEKIKEVAVGINGISPHFMQIAQEKLDSLTKPQGSLGRLEELAKVMVAITGNESPALTRKVIFTLASDHGVAEEKVSAFPKEVTAQMVYNFLSGGAGINVLARHINARVVVVDVGVAEDLKPHPDLIVKKISYGTKNMAIGPAMSRQEAIKSVENGFDIFEEEFRKGIDIIGTGEMGIANTTPSSAITAVFTKKDIEDIVGRGTGIDDSGLKNKIRVIRQAIEINKPNSNDAIDVLAKVGGFEIGGLAGIILSAASNRIPVVIDGFISGAAALIANGIAPKVRDYMIASHNSVEKGHKAILDYLGLKPLLDLEMKLGEGTGACLGIGLAEAAIKILTQMNTFDSAKVSQKLK